MSSRRLGSTVVSAVRDTRLSSNVLLTSGLVRGYRLAEAARHCGHAQRAQQVCMQLAKLNSDDIVAAAELLGPQPQRPIPEVIINLRQLRIRSGFLIL